MKISLRFTKVLLFVLVLLLCLPTAVFADNTESSYQLYVNTPEYYLGYKNNPETIPAIQEDRDGYAYIYFYAPDTYKYGPTYGYMVMGGGKSPQITFNSYNTNIYTASATDDVTVYVNGFDAEYSPWFALAEGSNYFNVHVEKAGGTEDYIFTLNTPVTKTWTNPFTDISVSSNYYNGVAYCNQKNLINGTSAITFSPDTPATRAMVVTILYRMEGSPAISGNSPFTDVAPNDWFCNAVLWASQQGIVNGYEDGTFGANNNITREQLAAILFRYAYTKINSCYYSEMEGVTDVGEVASYAVDSVQKAVLMGILNVQNKKINPDGSVTRGDLAVAMAALNQNVLTTMYSMLNDYPSSIPFGHYAPEKGEWITGETFGTDSYSGNTNNDTYDKAWDNDVYTFFDPVSGATEDCYTGIKTDKPYILTEIRILPRYDWTNRFNGATIQGSNDGKKWTTLWASGAAASSWDYQIISAVDLKNNNGYKMFRYVNLVEHGDVAEIELYGYVQD